MELYEVKFYDKFTGLLLSRNLCDDLEVRGIFVRLSLKGEYVESRLLNATRISVMSLDDADTDTLLTAYERYRELLNKLMEKHNVGTFGKACALSKATEEIWKKLSVDGFKRFFSVEK